MTTTDAAQLLGVSPRTIQRWCEQHMIESTWVSQQPQRRREISAEALLVTLNRWGTMDGVIGIRRLARAGRVLAKAVRATTRKDGG